MPTPTLAPAEVLNRLHQLRRLYVVQDFIYTEDQRREVEMLRRLRQQRVAQMYAEGRVFQR